jgi:hypothetical protein
MEVLNLGKKEKSLREMLMGITEEDIASLSGPRQELLSLLKAQLEETQDEAENPRDH